ncbi:MAG: hypothetical protein J6P21_03510 [Clostridia bacterium]|nr:hypothetical protein [Clostridia bacterium]
MVKFSKKKLAMLLAVTSVFDGKTSGVEEIKLAKTFSALPVEEKYQPKNLTKFESIEDLKKYFIASGCAVGTGASIFGIIKLINYFNNKKIIDKQSNLNKLIGVDDNDEINKSDILSDELLMRYLEAPVIPKSIIRIASNIKGGIYFSDFSKATYKNDELARYHGYPYKSDEKRTELEKDIDKLVDGGFMHLKYTTEEQLDRLLATVKNNSEFVKMPRARFYSGGENDEKNVPGTDFFKYKSAENSMAVVCSQYNALESGDDVFSSLLNWFGDDTQGPRMSLSAYLYAMLRILSYLKNKLNDAIDNVLGKELMNLPVSVGHVLYQHGYLNLARAYRYRSNLFNETNWQALVGAVKKNISNFKLNFQWVLCNDGTPMIQVFAAAPCMQGMYEWWNGKDAKRIMELCNPICMTIQVHQMKMIGKLAKLIRIVSGKPFALHVWLPGGRSFANHPDVLQVAAEALIDEVRDVDIDVYFHNRTPGDPLEKALKAKGVEYKIINGLELK